MVVGGYPWAASEEVEVFNIEDQGQSCTAKLQFPPLDGAIGGAFSDDAPVICGGGNSHLKRTDQCFIQKTMAVFQQQNLHFGQKEHGLLQCPCQMAH